jgi:hypothetical protein
MGRRMYGAIDACCCTAEALEKLAGVVLAALVMATTPWGHAEITGGRLLKGAER